MAEILLRNIRTIYGLETGRGFLKGVAMSQTDELHYAWLLMRNDQIVAFGSMDTVALASPLGLLALEPSPGVAIVVCGTDCLHHITHQRIQPTNPFVGFTRIRHLGCFCITYPQAKRGSFD